ncbi:hypothetical protein Tco_0750597 [Tanacetum coccineum]|uniref:Transposase (putative) gypsy type domain-containing protein n=1 Tax=Tanacetum coccineum TaxID=301880 RepID=A0ABQ4Z352_9ASTR
MQMCTLRKNELCQFLTAYGIHPEYKDMLPKSNQTIYDAPNNFVGLYTHSFSLVNLGLLLLKYFYDVLEYFCIHVSRLNPFGFAKLTNFAVMCKAYGGKPTIKLFRGFFNLYPGGQWMNFAKRPEKDVPNVLHKDNRWDKRSFKDIIPPLIHENPLYQRLGRHPVNVQTFPDPILFLDGLKLSWEHKMAFRNFMFAEDDEDISFLPREQSIGFGTASPTVSINHEPPSLEIKPLDSANPEQLVENTADSRGFLVREEMPIIGSGSMAKRMKNRKCLLDVREIQLDAELLDPQDRCYARQAIVDNAVNHKA